MPQMAPLMWTPLMISFSLFLIFTSILMYFSVSSKTMPQETTGSKTSSFKSFNLIWSW